MKKTLLKAALLCAAVLMCGSVANAQANAETVIRKSREKCQSIQGGHYVVDWKKKFMSDKDTNKSRLTCDFKKLPNDTIFKKAFALLEEPQEHPEWNGRYLYTGDEFVYIHDSSATILSCAQWAETIMRRRHNFEFYTALTNPSSYPVPSEENMADSNYTFSLIETRLDGKPCYLVDILGPTEEDESFGIKCIRYEMNLWIDKEDYLPLQYSIAYDLVEQQDTMYQYDEFKLLAFEPGVDESKLTLEALPDHVVLKDYVPDANKAPEPLAEGTLAPDWSLPTLTGDTVRLADLKGKVVLVDFFYKSCAPCCAALPFLQSLHEKYKDRGFVMIGIDPYDDPAKDEMAGFLAKRGVTYTVLFSERDLPQTYHVAAYPTLFFLGREGNIVRTQRGFSKVIEGELEEQLLKLL